MRTTIVTRQMEGGVPKDLQEIFETKLAKYDKFFRDDAATVKLSRVRGRERVEITISSAGVLYRGEETDETFRNAFDSATGAIERQIRKNKTRLEKRLREGAIADLYTPEPEKEDEEAMGDAVVLFDDERSPAGFRGEDGGGEPRGSSADYRDVSLVGRHSPSPFLSGAKPFGFS